MSKLTVNLKSHKVVSQRPINHAEMYFKIIWRKAILKHIVVNFEPTLLSKPEKLSEKRNDILNIYVCLANLILSMNGCYFRMGSKTLLIVQLSHWSLNTQQITLNVAVRFLDFYCS